MDSPLDDYIASLLHDALKKRSKKEAEKIAAKKAKAGLTYEERKKELAELVKGMAIS